MEWNYIDGNKNKIMPPTQETVQLAIRDDSGDTTSYGVIAGWRLMDDIFISDNDVVRGEVYAWKPLDDVPHETRKSCTFCTYYPELWMVSSHHSKSSVMSFYKTEPNYCPECGSKLNLCKEK